MENEQNIVHVMHVVQYIEIGGLETLVMEICKNTDPNAFKVSVLCLNGYDEKYASDLVRLGIKIFVVKKNGRFDLSFIRRVGKIIISNDVDVLHAHSGCLFYAALFSVLYRVRTLVFTAHGMPILNGVKDIIEDNIASLFCYKIVAVSDELENMLKSRMLLAREKFSLIRNGVDSSKFVPSSSLDERNRIRAKYGFPPHAFVIGSVGRLETVKNYDMLLKAF